MMTAMIVLGAAQAAAAQSVYSSVDGQATRFDYIVTAGDVHFANLLLLQFVSLWAFYFVYLFLRGRK